MMSFSRDTLSQVKRAAHNRHFVRVRTQRLFRRTMAHVKPTLVSIVSVGLMISLLANSTPAASQTIVGTLARIIHEGPSREQETR